MSISLDRQFLKGHIGTKDVHAILPRLKKIDLDLNQKRGEGSEFTGWLDLPGRIEDKFLRELEELGIQIRSISDCFMSIGIGGSYLGIRATIEALGGNLKLPIYYAGHNLSSDYLYHLIEQLKDQRLSCVVISKSGTTTEPAIAFRVIRQLMKAKYSDKELKQRIICVTDEKKGALKKIAEKEGCKSFVIPDDVGGRFSVLTPVGLVPLAIAGVDIQALVEGARTGQVEYASSDFEKNLAYQYAVSRFLLYKKGKVIEVLSSFYDNMFTVAEWWKQLFGESEGKGKKGIFPASLILSTDLHSMGQWMQEGPRRVFETFLMIDEPRHKVVIPEEKDNLDSFNYVAGKGLDFVNKQAFKAASQAHYEGGVPSMTITLARADSFHLGQLYYFFQKAVAISGYLLGVNPFDQPGVEAYKTKMFEFLKRT